MLEVTSFQLPPEVTTRIAGRLNELSGELHQAMDEVREFGHSCLLVRMTSPVTGESFQVLLAPAHVKVAMDHRPFPRATPPA